MSCTHDCGCTPETRDARTDEWVQIAPESARPATLTPEQPVKAPGQGENSQSPSGPVLPRRRTLYVSGPMTGLPDFNRAAFHKAADDLRARGYDVVNPAEVDLGPKATWEDYMRVHLATITSGDVHGLAMLPGWRKSKGARLEGDVARAFGLPMRWCHDWPVIEDAPEPVDPDAAVIKAIITAYRRSPECSTGAVFGEAMLDHLRAQGFDVKARAEQ